MTSSPPPSPAPGWYPDPETTEAQIRRFWDGRQWTDRYKAEREFTDQRAGSTSPGVVTIAGGILLALLVVVVIAWLLRERAASECRENNLAAYDRGEYSEVRDCSGW